MDIVRIDGEEFRNCWMPLVSQDRYFLVEYACGGAYFTVFHFDGENIRYEFLRNTPVYTDQVWSLCTWDCLKGIDSGLESPLYVIRRSAWFAITLHLPGDSVLEVRSRGHDLQAGPYQMECRPMDGYSACCLVTGDGGVAANPRLPAELARRISVRPAWPATASCPSV